MIVTPVMRKFILHWGEMGARWGINRTMAQIHALLYLSTTALHAEEIAEALSVARSNVSNSLRELQGWNIVRIVHVMGDRRDHYESVRDVWEMFQTILDERKRREVDPTVAILRECVAAADQSGGSEPHVRDRLRALLGFFETMTEWYGRIRQLPANGVMKFARMGHKVRSWLGLGA